MPAQTGTAMSHTPYIYCSISFFPSLSPKVCWVMLAVTAAIRDDIYAVVFVLLLGLLLVVPRRALRPLWLPVMLIQGLLLLWQYSLTLGLPPLLCGG